MPQKSEFLSVVVEGDVGRGVQLPDGVADLIVYYRRGNPSHGFKRIADLLKEQHLVVVAQKQIRRVLKQAGVLETCDSSFDVEASSVKGSRRFEAWEGRANAEDSISMCV